MRRGARQEGHVKRKAVEKQKSFSLQLSSAGDDQGGQTNNFFLFICSRSAWRIFLRCGQMLRLTRVSLAVARQRVVVVVAVASRIWPLICSV